MDVTELHDEENLLVQMQDRWENYGSLDGIADTHDPFDLAGAPRFELYEKINNLLNHALTADENLLLRQTLGMGCKQRSIVPGLITSILLLPYSYYGISCICQAMSSDKLILLGGIGFVAIAVNLWFAHWLGKKFK